MIFPQSDVSFELVELIAVTIELAQGYIKARHAALPLKNPVESYGALPLQFIFIHLHRLSG